MDSKYNQAYVHRQDRSAPWTEQKKVTQRTNGSKRRLRAVFFVLFCFIAWAGFTLWEQTAALDGKMAKLADMEESLLQVQEEYEANLLEIDRLNDPEYIEQRLRKDHYMTKEGETLFIKSR